MIDAAVGTDLALTPANVTVIGIGVIVVFVLVGLLVGALITAVLARLVIAVVVVVAAVLVWQQRTSLENKVSREKCQLSATFFGVHVDAPADVRRFCRRGHLQS